MKLSTRSLGLAAVLIAAVCCVSACTGAKAQEGPKVEAPKMMVSPHLIHRYSFTTDGRDSIGKVDGKAVGSASIAGGSLVLKGAADAYFEFAGQILPAGGSTTIVMWFTSSDAGNFARLLNIGDDDGTIGSAFVYITPHTTNGNTRVAISAGLTATKTFIDSDPLDDGKPHMLAVVISGTDSKLHVYVDGTEPKPAEDLGANTLDKVGRKDNWIGKSPFSADAPLNGSVDELRIYDHAMAADEVMLNFKAGADTLPPGK